MSKIPEQGASAREQRMLRILNGELSPGAPEDEAGAAYSDNMRGKWARAVLTNVNQLGNGAGSPVTFSHNLNLPLVVVPGRAYNQRNVIPWVIAWVFGDRTGANAAPAATANPAHNTLHFRLGDTVAANSIQMRVHSGLPITATEPLTVDVFFIPVPL